MVSRDDGVRKYDHWGGFLTHANIEDVRTRCKEMFTGKLVVVVFDPSWQPTQWPEVHTGVLLTNFEVDSRPAVGSLDTIGMLIVASAASEMMWETTAATQHDALSRVVPQTRAPALQFNHESLSVSCKSPSGHDLLYQIVLQLDENGETQLPYNYQEKK